MRKLRHRVRQAVSPHQSKGRKLTSNEPCSINLKLLTPSSRNTMPQLEVKSLEMRTPQATKTAVLVIGGAEDKVHGREILRTFFIRAGGNKAYITIIPSASREPAIIAGRYVGIFEEMGAEKVEILDIRER